MKVEFDGATYLEHVSYNAAGQALLTVLGNNTMTRQAYDPLTGGLLRTRTEKYTLNTSDPNKTIYQPGTSSALRQDDSYISDLIGDTLCHINLLFNSGVNGTWHTQRWLRQ